MLQQNLLNLFIIILRCVTAFLKIFLGLKKSKIVINLIIN